MKETKADLQKRVAELEKKVTDLEARPPTQVHYHFESPLAPCFLPHHPCTLPHYPTYQPFNPAFPKFIITCAPQNDWTSFKSFGPIGASSQWNGISSGGAFTLAGVSKDC